MIYIDILFILLISLLTWFALKRNLLLGFLVLVLSTPLAHKEDFSLIIWDFIPSRVILINIFIFNFLSIINFARKNGFKKLQLETINFLSKDVVMICLLILLIFRGISIFFVADQIFSLKLYAFFASIVLLYANVRILYLKYKMEFVKATIKAYLYIGVFTTIFAGLQLYLRYFDRTTIGAAWVIPGFTPRLGSTFWDVNHYGGFLIILIPLAISQIFIYKSKLKKSYLILITLVFITALAFTQSRSAWLGGIIGLSVYTVFMYLHGYKKLIITLIFTGLIAISTVFFIYESSGNSLVKKASDFMHHRLDSTDTHVFLLEGAAEIFFDKLAFGAGYGNFNTAFRETTIAEDYFSREPRLKQAKVPPHSVWGELIAENGGVGAISYIFMIVFVLLITITSIYKSKLEYQILTGIAVLSSLSAILVTGIFYSYNLEFYWIAIFLAAGYSYSILQKDYNPVFLINWWQKSKIAPFIIILPFTLFVMYANLGRTTLIDWDEAIYAKVARNMITTGDYLSLHWDSLTDYWYEKPPLYMWLTAILFMFTGYNSFGARFIAATFGVLTVIAVYYFAKSQFNKFTGILAALILASTIKFIFFARNGILDVPVSFFIVLTIYMFYIGYKSYILENKTLKVSIKYFIYAGVFCGLGVMTKAIIGFLPLVIIGFFLLLLFIIKKVSFVSITKIIGTIFGVSLLVAGPWHVYSYLVHGYDFLDTYLLSHIISRGLEGKGHVERTWFYVDVIKVSYRIWLAPFLLVPLLFIKPLIKQKNILPSIYAKLETKISENLLLLTGVVIIFCFFTASKDKLFWYIVPIYPFMAILSARVIERSVYLFNSLLDHKFRPSTTTVRFTTIFIILLTAVFYTIYKRELAYTPDVNKDKVALVKINNGLFPVNEYPDRNLYFNNIDPPVPMFYSDAPVSHASKDRIIELIQDSDPDETLSFLTPDNVYYNVRNAKSTSDAPIVIESKGSAGRWILFVSKSKISLLLQEITEINRQLKQLANAKLTRRLSSIEEEYIIKSEIRKLEIIGKLNEYGYTYTNTD